MSSNISKAKHVQAACKALCQQIASSLDISQVVRLASTAITVTSDIRNMVHGDVQAIRQTALERIRALLPTAAKLPPPERTAVRNALSRQFPEYATALDFYAAR